MDQGPDVHLLRQLVFPARYESLAARLGDDVARLLVPPGVETEEALERIGISVRNRDEGILVPAYGPSGTGKTTLANNVTNFLPTEFAPSILHTGDVDFDSLLETVQHGSRDLLATDSRTIPVNIDHRESNPPTPAEIAAIKRFLREAGVGHRCVILWPETSEEIALRMTDQYRDVAGTPPVELPLRVEGPSRDNWVDIAIKTLELSNSLSSLEEIGIDPRNYAPDDYLSLGAFLGQISKDFSDYVYELISSTQKTLALVIAFVSESPNAGVLSQLTSSTHYGLVDAHALVGATPESEVGRWWATRPGLLTQTVVRLDCRALCLPPPASIRILRRFGPDGVKSMLDDVGVGNPGQELLDSIERADLGRFLAGTARPTFEARGTPATTTTPAFQLLGSEYGFSGGKDKELNGAIKQGIEYFLREKGIPFGSMQAETGLGFVPLIPDNAVVRDESVVCIEYAWRAGEFLTTGNRSTIAQYVLTKLRNYSRELGWS